MKSLAMIAAALVIAGGADAQGVNAALCLARNAGESTADYALRNQHNCEIKWREMVAANQTGDWTHKRWLDHCRRECGYAPESGSGGAALSGAAPVVGAVLAAGGVIGAAVALKSGGGGNQTSVSP